MPDLDRALAGGAESGPVGIARTIPTGLEVGSPTDRILRITAPRLLLLRKSKHGDIEAAGFCLPIPKEQSS